MPKKHFFTLRTLFVFILGCLSVASVFLIQVPIQQALSKTTLMFTPLAFPKALLLAMVAGFVQELFKALPPFIIEDKVIGGVVSGLGFGMTEAVLILVNAIILHSLSSVVLLERFFAIIFHVSSTGIVMWGYTKKKFILSYLIISIIHGIIDTFPFLYQFGKKINPAVGELIAALVSISLLITFVYLYKRKTKLEENVTL